MAVREFDDSSGVRWRVWDTVPQEGRLLRPDFKDGWLTFESEHGRCRLAPVLQGWEQFPTEKLEMLLRIARTGGSLQEGSADV